MGSADFRVNTERAWGAELELVFRLGNATDRSGWSVVTGAAYDTGTLYGARVYNNFDGGEGRVFSGLRYQF